MHLLLYLLAQFPTPAAPSDPSLLRQVESLAQTVQQIGTTNTLLILIGFFGFVFWRITVIANKGQTPMSALLDKLIALQGTTSAKLVDLGERQMKSEETNHEQRDDLITVLKTSSELSTAINGNLGTLIETLKNHDIHMNVFYTSIMKGIGDINADQKIFTGEVDLMRKHEEKTARDIGDIKEQLGRIEKMVADGSMAAAERKAIQEMFTQIEQKLETLAREIRETAAGLPSEAVSDVHNGEAKGE